MLFNFPIAVAAATLAAMVGAAPVVDKRQTSTTNFGLYINGDGFDINYLQTFRLSYANSSAYIGEMKYQLYAEPLIVGGAGVNGAGNGISFLSIHQTPTGYQEMYIIPHQSQPIGFSVPHGGQPAGVRTTNFSFNEAGKLLNIGRNLFFACQDAELAAINSYQIYWLAAGQPRGFSCLGPLTIVQSDACSRE